MKSPHQEDQTMQTRERMEAQVATITAEIAEQYGDGGSDQGRRLECFDYPRLECFDSHTVIEDVVRAVIAMYDVSNIARPGSLENRIARLPSWPQR
jgi:hypothetical protein